MKNFDAVDVEDGGRVEMFVGPDLEAVGAAAWGHGQDLYVDLEHLS